ncbi:unnamed protein product [Ectocarpus sp. 6 AP-2014]
MESAGDRGGGGAHGGEPVMARKRFRLDMDLGSDSDSSTEQDALPRGGSRGRDPVQSYPSASNPRHQASPATGQRQHQQRGGMTNSYRQIAQGDDDDYGDADDYGTTFRSSDSRSRGNGGGKGRWSREDGRDAGQGWGPGAPYLDDAQETICSQPKFVTPDHAEPMQPPRLFVPPPMTNTRPHTAVQNPYKPSAQATPDSHHQTRRVTAEPARSSGSRSPRSSSTGGTSAARSIGASAQEAGGGDGYSSLDGAGMDRGSALRQMPSLVGVKDVYPPELSRIWPFQNFNAIQSALFQTAAKSDKNVVVSAPTGCGKTVVLEMAIARLWQESGGTLGNRKVIYISPIKALCQQTLDDWTAKFSPLGIRLAELTSDSTSGPSKGSVSLRDLASADVILTTPEKWDSITRRWKEHAFLVGTVALVLVDEVHTIGEERGATLEVILARMKMVSRSTEVVSMGLPASRMRFIALSATLPNANDFGSFLGAEVFRFGDEFRPVPLQTHVAGYPSGSNPFLFDRGLNNRVAGTVASLAIVVATTTLAMGVNLPARLVVIKGTNQYRGAQGYKEMPRSAILQMIGRAGRQGFDSSGVAVVMTSERNKKALERLSAGQEAVESSLQAKLLEALNSELRNAGVIAMDEDEFSVQPTPHGVLFSRFMVRFESMKAILGVSENHGTRDILRVCAECNEVNVPLRRAEKRFLNDLNQKVRYSPPKKEVVRTPADKALVLLQAALGGLHLDDWTLRGEQTAMLDTSARLLGCCAESLAVAGRGGGLGCAVSLRLMRSFRLRLWMDAERGQLKQLPGVGDTMSGRLEASGIITLTDLGCSTSVKVDAITGRKHPFGNGIRHAALQLLTRALTASVSRQQMGDGRQELQVRVEPAFQTTDPFSGGYIEPPDEAYAPPPTGWRRNDTNFQLLVYYDGQESSSSSSPLMLFRKINMEGMHSATLPVEAIEKDVTIHLWLICSGVCGMDVADVRIKPSSLDSRFASVADLRAIWSQNARRSSNQDAQDEEDEADPVDESAPASDRAGWSDWETNDKTTRKKPAGGHSTSERGSSGAKRGRGGKSGGAGAGRGKGKGKGKGKGGRAGVGVGSEGERQLDLASSFKAAALSEKRARAAGRGGAGGGGAAKAKPSEGMNRGELGAIGVSEAGDDLGIPPAPGRPAKRKAESDAAGTSTPAKQPTNGIGRTWGSKGRGSGSVTCSNIGTYHPDGTAMRTVLRHKGSELNMSSSVEVDRLGRNGSSSSSPSPGTIANMGPRWLSVGFAAPGGSASSRRVSVGRRGNTSTSALDVGEGSGGGAAVELFSESYDLTAGSPEDALGAGQSWKQRANTSGNNWVGDHAARGAGAGVGQVAIEHPLPLTHKQPPERVMHPPLTAASSHTPSASSGRPPAARSWGDVSRQQGKGRHAVPGVGRAVAVGEPPGDEWALGGARAQQEDVDRNRFIARATRGGGDHDAGVRDPSLLSSPIGGYGGAASGSSGGGGGGRGWKAGANTSSFFDRGDVAHSNKGANLETWKPAMATLADCNRFGPNQPVGSGAPTSSWRPTTFPAAVGRNEAASQYSEPYPNSSLPPSTKRGVTDGRGSGRGEEEVGAGGASTMTPNSRGFHDSPLTSVSTAPISATVSRRGGDQRAQSRQRVSAPALAGSRMAGSQAGGAHGGSGAAAGGPGRGWPQGTEEGRRRFHSNGAAGGAVRRGEQMQEDGGGWFGKHPTTADRGDINIIHGNKAVGPRGAGVEVTRGPTRMDARAQTPETRPTAADGDASAPVGHLSAGCSGGGGGGSGGRAEDAGVAGGAVARENVATKLDFHTVFD